MPSETKTIFATQAWIDGAWAKDVLLEIDAKGCWAKIQPNTPLDRWPAAVIDGALLPGVVNAHSHAFQRAIAGLTEACTGVHAPDDFWSWRDRMYSAANRITPAQLEVIARQLYRELLAGGYTHVCEFHYLHHDLNGTAYADPAEMALALVRASQHTGIGLTLLPTLYMRSGFNVTGLRHDQRRFASTPEAIIAIIESINRQTAGMPNINTGVALHSLRAVPDSALNELDAYAGQHNLPVHIHIAEQIAEVDDCVAHTGQRPIEWLLDNVNIDARWNLVHATHANAIELRGIAERGAAIVLCPTTEANLGDGVFPLPQYAACDGRWSVGSDSHISRAWPEELRMLEYSQRLTLRQRNIAAQALRVRSTAAAMFEALAEGGCAASGRNIGRIALGQRADFVVLDRTSSNLLGIPSDQLLDAAVFSTPSSAMTSIHVGGKPMNLAPDGDFEGVMRALWHG